MLQYRMIWWKINWANFGQTVGKTPHFGAFIRSNRQAR